MCHAVLNSLVAVTAKSPRIVLSGGIFKGDRIIHFHAHFDGKHICPGEPVSLPQGVPLRVTVDEPPRPEVAQAAQNPADVFAAPEAECGLVDGPPAWSAEHDHYLFGAALMLEAGASTQ
jgi:hypothetical protein